MNNTLKSFAGTLRQVAPSFGASVGQRGLLVAGVLALASAAPAQAQVSAQLVPGQPVFQAEQQAVERAPEGLGETAARNIGRLVGGLLGYTVGRATDAGTGGTVLAAVGGIFAGDQVAKTIHRDQRADADRQAAASSATGTEASIERVLQQSAAPAAQSNKSNKSGKAIAVPADIADRMTSLVVDAAAHRLIAQQAWSAAAKAEIDASLSPRDAKAAAEASAQRENFRQAMRRNNEAFYWFRNAVGALQGHGYNVEPYLEVNKSLSRQVDKSGQLDLAHPAIVARAAEIAGIAPGVPTAAPRSTELVGYTDRFQGDGR